MTAVNRIITIMVLALGMMAAAFLAVTWFDPVNVALRSALSSTWFTAQQLVILSGAAGFSAIIVGFGIQRLVRAFLVYPQDALYPAAIWLRMRKPKNEPRAQVTRAAMKDVDRLNAATMRQLLNPPLDEALLPAPEPQLFLPERIDVFDAPLPATPALLLGMGERGPITLELGDAGHVLVGGSPRRGKTNFLAAMIAGLARQDPTGRIAQVALADLKRMDFALLPPDLALLRAPVAYDPVETMQMLGDVDTELNQRMTAFAGAGVKNLAQWNQRGTRWPYIVLIVDEVAELTTHPSKDERDRFIELLRRIGQLGGAAGIIEVLATQRPSSNVLPTQITGIADTRVAFRTATRTESDLILNDGAAALLPDVRGRCIIRRDAIQPAQAYYAGLIEGTFDRYMLSLPRRTPDLANAIARLDDDPTTVATVATAHNWQNGGVYQAVVPVVQLDHGREPTPEEAEAMRQQYRRTPSKTALCKRFYGYKDGVTFDYVTRALEGEI